MLYYIGAKKSRRSAVGSARGLGPWGRRFAPCRLDHIRPFFKEIHQNLKTVNKIKKCYFLRILENSTIFLRSKKFSKIPIFCSEKCSAIFEIFKKIVPQISAKQNSLIFRYFQCCLKKLKGELLLWILYLIK